MYIRIQNISKDSTHHKDHYIYSFSKGPLFWPVLPTFYCEGEHAKIHRQLKAQRFMSFFGWNNGTMFFVTTSLGNLSEVFCHFFKWHHFLSQLHSWWKKCHLFVGGNFHLPTRWSGSLVSDWPQPWPETNSLKFYQHKKDRTGRVFLYFPCWGQAKKSQFFVAVKLLFGTYQWWKPKIWRRVPSNLRWSIANVLTWLPYPIYPEIFVRRWGSSMYPGLFHLQIPNFTWKMIVEAKISFKTACLEFRVYI